MRASESNRVIKTWIRRILIRFWDGHLNCLSPEGLETAKQPNNMKYLQKEKQRLKKINSLYLLRMKTHLT